MLSSPRRPDTTIRIFSSAEYCLTVLRRISRTTLSAESLLLNDFWLIFVPFGHYDEPKILPYANTSIGPKDADVRQPEDDDSLRLALVRLAKQYGRYGYRKIAESLRIEGWQVNHKKVERLWREEGLQIPQRHRKRKRLYHKDSSVIRLRPKYQNHIWSVDFVHDKLAGGRPYKMLTVLDEYSREALCVAVKPRMGNAEVLEALYPLFLKHGSSRDFPLTMPHGNLFDTRRKVKDAWAAFCAEGPKGDVVERWRTPA